MMDNLCDGMYDIASDQITLSARTARSSNNNPSLYLLSIGDTQRYPYPRTGTHSRPARRWAARDCMSARGAGPQAWCTALRIAEKHMHACPGCRSGLLRWRRTCLRRGRRIAALRQRPGGSCRSISKHEGLGEVMKRTVLRGRGEDHIPFEHRIRIMQSYPVCRENKRCSWDVRTGPSRSGSKRGW